MIDLLNFGGGDVSDEPNEPRFADARKFITAHRTVVLQAVFGPERHLGWYTSPVRVDRGADYGGVPRSDQLRSTDDDVNALSTRVVVRRDAQVDVTPLHERRSERVRPDHKFERVLYFVGRFGSVRDSVEKLDLMAEIAASMEFAQMTFDETLNERRAALVGAERVIKLA